MTTLEIPPRVSLACLPTRIQHLPRISGQLDGLSVYVKRDDETGADLSGNKVRKLEFLLADARAQSADLVITCGGVQSNHCRATAIAARRLGMDSLLFLRGSDPGERDGNLFLDALSGADLRFITPEEYGERDTLMAVAAREASARGRRAYVIPEGGSNALGAFGYLTMLEEILLQGVPEDHSAGSRAGQVEPAAASAPAAFPWDHIVCATGSGGTLAGLILGAKLRGLPVRIWGVNVCDTARWFEDRVLAIADEMRANYPAAPAIEREDIRILEGYKGPGYAKAFPELLDLIRDVARHDGLFLDPVYTGKAFYGMMQEARAGRFGLGRVLFLHTGGVFSLFAWKRELLGA